MTTRTDPIRLWQAILQAGSMDAYVEEQLKERGYLSERRETDGMSKRKLAQYKKQLKEEATERKRLKKEAWTAYRANHIVHLGDGVYWNDADNFDKWDLEDAEVRAAENDLPPLDSPKQLAEALNITMSRLRWLAYHRDAATFVHYRRFVMPKRGGGERAIWAPLPEMKRAQHWVLRNIAEKLPVHGSAHGFLPARSILTNASVHQNAAVVVKMDLKDFFPTVSFPRVKGIFRKAGYREQIAIILALICTESPRKIVEHNGKVYYISLGARCLPQGAPTSPALTNTLCLKMDRRLTGLAQKQGWRYTRYADDLTFSVSAASLSGKGAAKKPKKSVKKKSTLSEPGDPASISKLIGSIKMITADEGFEINSKKTRILRSGSRQRITGLIVNEDQTPRVPREIKRRLRAAIHNLKKGKPLKDGESFQRLMGYANYIRMSEPEKGKALVDALRSLST